MVKNDNKTLVEIVDLLLEKYGNIKGDKIAFIAGVHTGALIGCQLSSNGVARLDLVTRNALVECPYDSEPLVNVLIEVNKRIIKDAKILPKLYYKEELRRSIYCKAYSDGVDFGISFAYKAFRVFVEKGCSTAAIKVLLPRYINRHLKFLLTLEKEYTDVKEG